MKSLALFAVGVFAAISSNASAAAAPNKYVGVLYETWFNAILDSGSPVTYPTIPSTGWMYWGQPALGNYKSDDPSVINTHANQLANAGIDFVAIDYSNDNIDTPDLNAPLSTVLQVYQQRLQAGIGTPRVVFLTSSSHGEVSKLWQQVYSVYSSNIFFNYAGKPLLLSDNCNVSGAANFTCRETHGLQNSSSTWSFLEHTPQPVVLQSGWPEQIAVSPAQQTTFMSNTSTAHGRSWLTSSSTNSGPQGQNYADQWTQADQMSPTFVLIDSWNQWAALNLGGNFTDEYNEQFSSDIEPQQGGHGDTYLTLTSQRVSRYKGNAANLYLRDASSGLWTMKFGRKGLAFAATNFSNTFSWAAGSNFQPIVGDFNNDGDTDIGLRDAQSGIWYFAFSNHNGYYNNTLNFSWAAGTNFQPVIGDFNDDGLTDIAMRDVNDGTWYFAFSNGQGYFNNTRNFKWLAGAQYQPVVGDFNGDGMTDIALRDATTGIWYFAYFDGNASYVNVSTFSWVPGANYQPFVGDFNCDGKLDIGLRDSITGNIYLANALGSMAFDNHSNIPWIAGANIAISVDPLQCK